MSNRGQRRAAASQARGNRVAAPPPANLSAEAAGHLNAAVQYHQSGDAESARQNYERVLAHDPRNIDALNLLGVLLHHLGELEAAAHSVAQAIKLHPPAPELHFNLGNIRRDQQRNREAAACYRKAKALNPNYFEAIYNLGVVLQQLGQDTGAIQNLERALSLNDRFAMGHCSLADIRLGRGENGLAIVSYEKALAIDPSLDEAHNNLAVALRETGDDNEALCHLEKALALNPTYSDAHYNIAMLWQSRRVPDRVEHHFSQAREHAAGDMRPSLGLAAFLHNQGRLGESLECYRDALTHDPQSPAILNNLGCLYRDLRQPADAVAVFEQALRADPDFPDVRCNLAHALRAQGRLGEAITHYRAALASDSAHEGVVAGLAQALGRLEPSAFDATLNELIMACFQGHGGRDQDLARIAAAFILNKYGPDWTPSGSGDETADFTAFAEDRMVLALLERTINVDTALERLLSRCRRHLLFATTSSTEPAPGTLRVMAALARQGHNNGYVFSVAENERSAVAALHKKLLLTTRESSTPTPELLALAMYQPLATVPWLTELTPTGCDPWWQSLLEMTVFAPAAEDVLRANIPALGAVADTTSRAVQAQYESNPYPRWLSLRYEPPISLSRRLTSINPALHIDPHADLTDVLIAGCGTGQQPIQFARANCDVNILAVDLSRASLAYAMRMARSFDVHNIRFMQADILDLPDLAREFPVIECVGVLHHMADPVAGLAALTECLAPKGFLRLGLYSRIARRRITAVQDRVKQQDIVPTASNIRAFRQQLLDQETAPSFAHPLRIVDFYDLNGCRDLLFHVRECLYSLPEISDILANAGLTFIGFDFEDPSVVAQFQTQHPAPEALADLSAWADYEAKNPDTFIGMYQFWCRKDL